MKFKSTELLHVFLDSEGERRKLVAWRSIIAKFYLSMMSRSLLPELNYRQFIFRSAPESSVQTQPSMTGSLASSMTVCRTAGVGYCSTALWRSTESWEVSSTH